MKYKDEVLSIEEGLKREWIITNGIGGYCSSTIIGANTRKYHGLLVAPLLPPAGRMLILSKLDENIKTNGKSYDLYTNVCKNYISDGYKKIKSFEKEYIPIFEYQVEEIKIKKFICMEYGKNTVEFRLPNGTINPNTWIENINLFGGIVKSAHELTMIQSKSEEQRTDSEKKVLDDFEILQTEEDENQIAKALIELCIPLEDRHIYMDRYRTNTPLLDASQDIKNAITDQISTNKIGKKLFTGKNAVKGEDYEQSSAIIEQALNEHDINYEMEQGG